MTWIKIHLLMLFLIMAKIHFQIIFQNLSKRFLEHHPPSLLQGYTVSVKNLLLVSFHQQFHSLLHVRREVYVSILRPNWN